MMKFYYWKISNISESKKYLSGDVVWIDNPIEKMHEFDNNFLFIAYKKLPAFIVFIKFSDIKGVTLDQIFTVLRKCGNNENSSFDYSCSRNLLH
jgi:hypothetical protein